MTFISISLFDVSNHDNGIEIWSPVFEPPTVLQGNDFFTTFWWLKKLNTWDLRSKHNLALINICKFVMDSQQLLWARVIVAVGQLVGDKRLCRYLRGSKNICRPHWDLISAPIVLLSKCLQGVKVQRFVLVQQLEHLGTGQLVPKDSTFMKILCFPSISRKLYSHPWKTLPDVFCAKCDTWVEKAARVLRILMEGIKNKVLTKKLFSNSFFYLKSFLHTRQLALVFVKGNTCLEAKITTTIGDSILSWVSVRFTQPARWKGWS